MPATSSYRTGFGGGAGNGRGLLVGLGPDGLGPPFFWATAMQSRPDTRTMETTADKDFHNFIGFLLFGLVGTNQPPALNVAGDCLLLPDVF